MALVIEELEKEQLKENALTFHTGDTVRVYGKIKEGNRERVQIFEGTVKKIQGGSSRTTFTVRKLSNNIGVEKTWPLHSPQLLDLHFRTVLTSLPYLVLPLRIS